MIRSGRKIIDIGADVNRARPSIFYEMEKNMLKNYQKLHPEFNNVPNHDGQDFLRVVNEAFTPFLTGLGFLDGHAVNQRAASSRQFHRS